MVNKQLDGAAYIFQAAIVLRKQKGVSRRRRGRGGRLLSNGIDRFSPRANLIPLPVFAARRRRTAARRECFPRDGFCQITDCRRNQTLNVLR